MKKVWIINHYATTEYQGQGGRPYCLSKYLLESGYDVRVFCASTLHGKAEQFIEIKDGLSTERIPESNVPHIFVKACNYEGNGGKRILNMLEFYINIFKVAKKYINDTGVPDIIIGSSVHPLACVAAILLAKKYKTKAITEIRDLWPETLVSYGIAGVKNFVVAILRILEKWTYVKADAVIFTMEGAYDYIVEQGWEKDIPRSKVHFVNNGVDLEEFDYNRQHFILKDADLENDEIFKVIYTGSIRKVNDLNKIVDAAKFIEDKTIRFLIWGDGNELERLKMRVLDEEIENVIFKGWVEKKYIPYITSKADLNIMHGQSAPVLRFGLSLNKMFDYFAAGRPILIDFYGQYNPVFECGAGVGSKSNSAEDIAKAVEEVKAMDAQKKAELCRGARSGAQKYDFKNLSCKLVEIFEDIMKENGKQ